MPDLAPVCQRGTLSGGAILAPADLAQEITLFIRTLQETKIMEIYPLCGIYFH